MTTAHWHLILTHLPIVLVPVGLGLISWGLAKKSQDLISASLVAFILCGFLAFCAKATGEGAEDQIKSLPDFSKHAVHEHEEMADTAFIFSAALALASTAILLLRSRRRLPAPTYPLLLLLALAAAASLIYTGALGGQIRHTEIRAEQMSDT